METDFHSLFSFVFSLVHSFGSTGLDVSGSDDGGGVSGGECTDTTSYSQAVPFLCCADPLSLRGRVKAHSVHELFRSCLLVFCSSSTGFKHDPVPAYRGFTVVMDCLMLLSMVLDGRQKERCMDGTRGKGGTFVNMWHFLFFYGSYGILEGFACRASFYALEIWAQDPGWKLPLYVHRGSLA